MAPATIALNRAIDTELGALAQHLRETTVQVRDGRSSAGSGIVWTSSGIVITNAHVAHRDVVAVEFSDGRIMRATLLARDTRRDLAALSINATGLAAACVGDSDSLRVGELVVALGNPLGMIGAMTAGIVHATPGSRASVKGRWIQADITLAPGNSGGPLADHEGRVVGVNSMIARGIALAVPSSEVQRFLDSR